MRVEDAVKDKAADFVWVQCSKPKQRSEFIPVTLPPNTHTHTAPIVVPYLGPSHSAKRVLFSILFTYDTPQ